MAACAGIPGLCPQGAVRPGQYVGVMQHWRTRPTVGAVAALALALLATTGAALTRLYRPEGSQRLVQAHELSIYLAIVGLVLWCAFALADRTQPSRRTALVVGSGVGAMGLVVLTAVAWNRVQFDGLGLWAVTVGNGARGLWYAAFSDEVRFMFVDGMGEVSPSKIAPWVVAHLVAPFVALALVSVGWLADRPPRGPRRSVVAPPAEPRPPLPQ
jgi:hypothetical protein